MMPIAMLYGWPITCGGGILTDATSKVWARAMTKPVATRSVIIRYIDFSFHTRRLSHDLTGILYQIESVYLSNQDRLDRASWTASGQPPGPTSGRLWR